MEEVNLPVEGKEERLLIYNRLRQQINSGNE